MPNIKDIKETILLNTLSDISIPVGIACTFFSNTSHKLIRESVHKITKHYIQWIGKENINAYANYSKEQTDILTDKKLTAILNKLLKNDEYRFEIEQNEESFSFYKFEYSGLDLSLPEILPEQRNYIEMYFPISFAQQETWPKFIANILSIAEAFPFESGYVNLAYFTNLDPKNEAIIQQIAFLYKGIDIPHALSVSFHIGNKIKAANWLTFIHPNLIKKVGIIEEIISKLNSNKNILTYNLKNGIAIQASSLPSIGNITDENNLSTLKYIAAIFEPITLIQEWGIFGFDKVEDFVEWQRRFLD